MGKVESIRRLNSRLHKPVNNIPNAIPLHTFASRLVQAGIPLYEIMHLNGHKSFEMIQRYSHLAPDYADRAIQALNAIGHDIGTVENRKTA